MKGRLLQKEANVSIFLQSVKNKRTLANNGTGLRKALVEALRIPRTRHQLNQLSAISKGMKCKQQQNIYTEGICNIPVVRFI